MKKRVGIWIRVSTEDQAQGDSPKHHEHRAKSYAEVKGWAIIEEYHLEAVSGKAVINHPEAQRMIEDIKRGHITGLIFSKVARLARNTRELLEFADIFQKYNADLISLEESIDTSSPAGRFFYTLIAGMAEWERAEIGSRVKASVGVRAKLGKPLGGEAPFGYKWENKELVLDTNEAPIRKLIHELFLEQKRKRTVAELLNQQGYRTRRGEKFSDTSIDRMLRDPIAKGMRRVNYTQSTGDGKKWKLKPNEEWVFIEAPRIVSDELWESCNRIIDEMAKKKGKVRRKGVHLFSGIVECECGTKMYMRTLSPKYVCPNCKNKIGPDDLEEIFHGQLENFLFSDTEIQNHLSQEKKMLIEKEELLSTRKQEFQKLKQKATGIMELYHDGQLSKESFSEYHTPVYEMQTQVEQSMMDLQGQIDALRMQSLDNVQVLSDAQNLHKQWKSFSLLEKKSIIEAITKSIVIGKEDIEINLSYIPTLLPESGQKINTPYSSEINDTTMQHTHRGSCWR
ncbi:MAG: recombinase family protein [Saprospiraceae bacterium]|nr:recombinase family protein [Saprospiraceae bacterium]MCF8252445.1 recombinase family protein [Saprospiraceae bacterium]MCF8282292.1 recombinase family protein [Bacteroidales bacterium]MCF8314029.1 recombinase family protein [Saprospiraceae bacterium]MCF8442775.1 recombinase family protein [Saprospiraceae bacterium]